MYPHQLIQYVTDTFDGLDVLRPSDGPGVGDTSSADPEHNMNPYKRQPFATVVTKNYGEFDNLSQLDRPKCFASTCS